jgi:hypothetical protein
MNAGAIAERQRNPICGTSFKSTSALQSRQPLQSYRGRSTEGLAKLMAEMGRVRKPGRMRRDSEVVAFYDLAYGFPHPVPSPITAEGNADLLCEQVLKPRGGQPDRSGQLLPR